MIQFSKPKRSLTKAMDSFRRHEISAKEALNGSTIEGNWYFYVVDN
jgi:regulator of nonsense transcripts 1